MDLGKWALSNKLLVYFLVAVLMVGGALACYQMSKLEDPKIEVKQAMVVTVYPGASAHQVEMEVTDVLEKKVRTLGEVDNVESYSYNDLSIILVELKSTVNPKDVDQCWDKLRRKVTDATSLLPAGANTPQTHDDFGSMYGMFFALTGDGLSEREMSQYAELVKRELSAMDGVDRVEVYGEQNECINIRLLQDKMSNLGVMPAEVLATLNGQNKTSYAGYYENGDQRVRVTVTDKFRQVSDIRKMIIQGHEDDQLRLSDIAEGEKGFETPIRNSMTYDGQKALGILVAANADADVVKVGKAVSRKMEDLRQTRFPTGVKLHKVFFQPDRVTDALGTFVLNLIESVVIVVALLMVFMGFKSGMIIGISLVVIVFGSFMLLGHMDGTMQRVSLGSFILAMGMLVDNAIVIIDGILVDLKAGKKREEALTSIGRQTAMPLLGATLIAILSFLPIFLSPDTAGTYVRDLFIVLAVSLLLSWILALVHVPLMADRWLHPKVKQNEEGNAEQYDSLVYRVQERILRFLISYPKSVVIVALGMIGLAVVGYGHMRQGFFPDLAYEQCYIEYKLPEGTNSTRVQRDLDSIQSYLRSRGDIQHITASIGGTPGRYNLVRVVPLPSLSYGELIVDFDSPETLNDKIEELQTYLTKHYPDAYVKVKKYNLMFKKYPIEAQFQGPDPEVLHALCDSAKTIMERSGQVRLITTNWEPKVPVLSVDYNQADARAVGMSRGDLSTSLMTAGGGIPVGNFYEGIYTNKIYVKCVDESGNAIDDLADMQVFSAMPSLTGLLTKDNLLKLRAGQVDRQALVESMIGTKPLRHVSRGINVEWEDPVVPRYNGQRMQRVQCSPMEGVETERARAAVAKEIEKMKLPEGYSLSWQGEKQASDQSMKYLFANFPLAIIIMIGILIMLFKDWKKPLIIFSTIPLVFAAVVLTMLVTQYVFTFVAIVGSLGLIGMIIKNGIVLMDEVELELKQGATPMQALINSSKSRLRPVMMASMTTVLGMIPLLTDAMFGSLAVTIMGGLLIGTFITLIFIPVTYAMVFKVNTEETKEETAK